MSLCEGCLAFPTRNGVRYCQKAEAIEARASEPPPGCPTQVPQEIREPQVYGGRLSESSIQEYLDQLPIHNSSPHYRREGMDYETLLNKVIELQQRFYSDDPVDNRRIARSPQFQNNRARILREAGYPKTEWGPVWVSLSARATRARNKKKRSESEQE